MSDLAGVTRPDPQQIPTTLMAPAMDAGQPAAQASPELAAAMAESRELRALVAEICNTLEGGRDRQWTARVHVRTLGKWRKRAGLEH